MIKFFRRIRQQLLTDLPAGKAGNRISKYLLYAIGEIVLVVIGILIALQFNQMREDRIDREKELAYLKEIHLDFVSNKFQLDSLIRHNSRALHSCNRLHLLIAEIKSEGLPEKFQEHPMSDSLIYYQRLSFSNMSFNPRNGSVRALINSSSFDLIQNDSLRRCLISWQDVLDDYLEEEQFAMDFLFNEYSPYQLNNYNYEDFFCTENIQTWFDIREYNFRMKRRGDLGNMLTTVESEGIVDMIDDIIRYTKFETGND
ncbi:MAG: DUF6090 family protein [Bacteroidota bacterium]